MRENGLKPAVWIERFEQVFKQIHATRIQGLPFLHQSLQVKAFGFEPYAQGYLGVLLTPWFMNLIVVADALVAAKVGSKQTVQLPAGAYDFIVNYEEPLGFYWSCSLFSPVLEFENQQAAEQTAQYALLAVLQAEAPEASVPPPAKPLAERLQQPLSRRAWLQGKFLRDG